MYNNIFGLLLTTLLLASCGNAKKGEEGDLNDKKAKLEALKKEQSGLNSEIANLEKELAVLDTSSGGGNYRGSGSYSGGSGRTSTYRGGSSARSRGGGSTDSGEQGDDLDRDFTADDFLEQAGGNRIKAQMLANIANSRKRRGRLRNVPQQRSSMRDNILRAIQESLTRPRTR